MKPLRAWFLPLPPSQNREAETTTDSSRLLLSPEHCHLLPFFHQQSRILFSFSSSFLESSWDLQDEEGGRWEGLSEGTLLIPDLCSVRPFLPLPYFPWS